MEALNRVAGVAAPLLRVNVDTDAIIPSREMKTVGKTGLAQGLFAAWRYRNAETREPDPSFVLNQPAYRGAVILLAGANFGCGSSREHAVWALKEFGFRVILAPSFGAIFRANCLRNGLLPAVLGEPQVAELAAYVQADPQARHLHVSLEDRTVVAGEKTYSFAIDAGARTALLAGRDAIEQTRQETAAIARWFAADRQLRPWLYTSIESPIEGELE